MGSAWRWVDFSLNDLAGFQAAELPIMLIKRASGVVVYSHMKCGADLERSVIPTPLFSRGEGFTL